MQRNDDGTVRLVCCKIDTDIYIKIDNIVEYIKETAKLNCKSKEVRDVLNQMIVNLSYPNYKKIKDL